MISISERESNLVSIFGLAESERLFVKCREEFRQSVKYPGAIYSDFPPIENPLPYFHISDEYRMFNPEGKIIKKYLICNSLRVRMCNKRSERIYKDRQQVVVV